ncbi:MAG: hypothetical protein EP338_08010 [Bacteroidetes bacterium]|nr:MAG: hypothetical protein EP338_08010 [Bacteroidota bacterium]
MKIKAIILIAILIGVYGCSKRTTPRKVEKRLTEGSWNVLQFIDNDSSLTQYYKQLSLRFGKEGVVNSNFVTQVAGKWSIGTDKNPAVIYIEFPEIDSLHVLSDDWVVTKIEEAECVLKRHPGAEAVGNKDFDYDAITDNLTLYKK